MSTDREVLRNRRNLVAARNLVNWAAIGLLFPFLGIIIAIVARQKVNYVIETDDNWEDIDGVRSSATMWIIISVIAALLWSLFWWLYDGNAGGVLF